MISSDWVKTLNKSLSFVLLAAVIFSAPAYADNFSDRFTVNGQVTLQHIITENRDLSTGISETAISKSVQPRIRVKADITENLSAYSDVRALLISADDTASAEDDTGSSVSTNENFLELRQAWLKYSNFLGKPPLSIQVGRQRLREDKTIWWNRDFDAVRAEYNSTLFKGFAGIGQNLGSYRTNESDYLEDEKDRFRSFAQGEWQYIRDHFFGARFLYEDDHSGIESVGSLVNAFDRDDEDFEGFWAGARLSGQHKPKSSFLGPIDYSVDLIGVAGEEDVLTTIAGPSPVFRQVSDVNNRDVLGWAFDGSVDIALNTALNPTLTFGYAYGSGDDDMGDGTNHAFRQSGLHGNSSRLGLSSGSVRNYGEVLRPELSNLHILTAGAGIPLCKASDVNAFYHYYRLAENATSFRQASIAAPLNGTDKSVGQGLDIVFNMNLSDSFGWTIPGLQDTRLKLTASGFKAGDAFGTADGETSFRSFAELQIRF